MLPSDIQSYSAKSDVRIHLRLQNLIKGRRHASIVDLKMGTNTITHTIKENPQRLQKRRLKDQSTTSSTLGFKVIGYVIKSAEKTVEEKFYKFPPKKEEEIPAVLRRILSWPKSEQVPLQHHQPVINEEARAAVLSEMEQLLDFLVHRSQRDIKGASILILADHFARSYTMKMIDLSTIEVYADPNQRDEGLILGLTNLVQFIKAL